MKLWDLNAGVELQELAGHRDDILAIALTRRGVIVSFSTQDGLKIWGPVHRGCFCSFTPDQSILCGALGPDEHTIVMGDRVGKIHVMKMTDGDLVARRAYDLYLKRGMVHGHALDDWLEAERETYAIAQSAKTVAPKGI